MVRIVISVSNVTSLQDCLFNCHNCLSFQNCQKIVKIVKKLVRSCFLITVIKYLKGHWSLGSLFNVKKQKVGQSVTHSLSDKVTY